MSRKNPRQKFLSRWIQHLPDSVTDDEKDFYGENFYAAEHDSYEMAEFHARQVASHGPRPDYWEVEERLLKGQHLINKPDTWITGRRWVCGKEVTA